MARIWRTRSAVPGDRNWIAGTLENLAPAAKFQDGEIRGDGVVGTLEIGGVDPADIVAANKVLIGNDRYVGGDAGTLTLPNTDGSTADASLVLNTAHFGPDNLTAGTLDMSMYHLVGGGAAGGETAKTVAEAVLTEIQGSSGLYTEPATVQRAYVPAFDLKDMGDLHITVVARTNETEIVSRSMVQHDIGVDVGIMQKLSGAYAGDNDEIDELMELVKDFKTFFENRHLAQAPSARWIDTVNEPPYMPEHLSEFGQFSSVLTLTYRVIQ